MKPSLILSLLGAVLSAVSLTGCLDPATLNALSGPQSGPGYYPPQPQYGGRPPGYYPNQQPYYPNNNGYYGNHPGYYDQGPGYYNNNTTNRPGPWQGNKSGVYDTAYRAGQDDYYRGKDKHMTNHKKLYDSNTHDTFKRGYEAGYDAARRKGKR